MKSIISIAIVALLSCYTMVCKAHNGKTAYAIPLSGISIDGNLDDWPAEMMVYPIEWVSPFHYKPTPPDGPEDFTASFRVGYDLIDNVLYVAVVVKDDDMVIHPDSPNIRNQDVCGIYVDPDHSGGDSDIQGRQMYIMVPGPGKWTADQDGNPSLNQGDTKASGMKGAFSHSEQTVVYEWAIPLFDSFPDKRLQIQPGVTIGLDFLVADADGQENANFVVWTPETGKSRTSDLFGHLVFLKSYEDLGTIAGTVTNKKEEIPLPGLTIEVYRDDQKVEKVKTNLEGQFHIKLQPAEYNLKLSRGQGIKSSDELLLTVRAGQESKADFTATTVELPEALERSAAAYKSLKGYRDTTTIEMHMVSVNMDTRITIQVLFAYEKPNRVRIENISDSPMGDIELFSNGEKMVSYMKMRKQYTEEDAPEVLTSANLQTIQSLIAKNIIMSDDPLKDLKKNIEEVKEVDREKLEGIPITIFELMQSASSLGSNMVPGQVGEDMLIPVRLWIGNKDNLIRKMAFELDMDQITKSLPEEQQVMMKGMKLSITERHIGIEINPVFSDNDFVFIPPEGAQLVENFGRPGRSEPKESKLINRLGPDFTLKDIEGNETKLVDFKGKVVLMDFWATWCGPCIKVMPHIQALSETYKEDDVIILGINSWEREKDKVESFLKEQKITYRILLDSNNEVIKKYGVKAIPTFFILDKKGIVRYSYRGMQADNQIIQQNIEELRAE